MKTLFSLLLPFCLLISVFFLPGCGEKRRKFVCKEEYLRDCIIIKIKKIRTTVQIELDIHKMAEAGVSSTTLNYKLRLADRKRKIKTVKAAEQFLIKDSKGKKHRLSEFAKIHLGIVVSYEEPWGENPFWIK